MTLTTKVKLLNLTKFYHNFVINGWIFFRLGQNNTWDKIFLEAKLNFTLTFRVKVKSLNSAKIVITWLVMDIFDWQMGQNNNYDKTNILISPSMDLTFIWPWLSRSKPYLLIKSWAWSLFAVVHVWARGIWCQKNI